MFKSNIRFSGEFGMGHYLNPGSAGFSAVLNNDIYVDKTPAVATYVIRVPDDLGRRFPS